MFKIRNKLLLVFLSVIIIPIIIISTLFTLHTTKSIKQNKITELQQSTETKAEKTISFVHSIERDIRSLAGNALLLNLEDAITKEDIEQINLWKSNLELLFKTFSDSKRIYEQIRFIDNSGLEIVRVDLYKDYANIVPIEELQDKSNRYYFKEAVKLNEGEIYISKLDLNREHGEIESPHKPMLRYAIPVFNRKKQKKGVLVLNVLVDYLFMNFLTHRPSERMDSYLLDEDGFYLMHPEKLKQWGGLGDLNTGENIQNDYPREVASFVLSGKSELKLVGQKFLNFIPINFDPLNAGRYWIYLESLDKSVVYSPIYTFYKFIGVLVLIITVGVVTAALIFSERLTRPLNELVKGATAVAKGDLDYKINVKSNDEFEFLTFSFNKMVYNLGKSRKQLQNYAYNLERKVEDKTKVLNEKLRQNEVLVEIGQLFWDEEDINNTMNGIVNLVSRTLKTEFCKILLLDKSKIYLRMVSGVGWKDGIVGHETVDVKLESLARYTLKELNPVVVKDLRKETRFSGSPLLVEYGIVSGLSVPMIVSDQVLGVLEVYSAQLMEFSKDDTNFLQSVGLIIAAAVERRRAEKEIKSEREYTGNLIEAAQDGIVCMDDKGIISIWNQSAEMIFGYSESEIIGQPITTIIPERYEKKHEDELQMFLTGNYKIKARAIEAYGITKEGVEIPVEMSLTAQRIENGKNLYTAIIRDLTERKKMEETLLQSEKLRSIGTITAGVSHEFNNILAVISGNVQLLEIMYDNHGQLTDALRTIKKATTDGAEISSRMLKFSKTEKDTTAFMSFDISSLLKQSIDFTMPRWKNMAQADGIRYQMDIEGIKEEHAVLCNPTEIREVFVNIIINALDAMPDGGRISFSLWSKEGTVFVSISDTGEGMSKDIRHNIFDPFFTTKVAVGTGLGMSTAYGIITRHGGKINVESEMGKGSTFTLQFPTTTKTILKNHLVSQS